MKLDGSDWGRFVVLMNEKRGSLKEFLKRMIKVWESWTDSKGTVAGLYTSTNYLPESKTALYKIATLNTSDINDDRKLRSII